MHLSSLSLRFGKWLIVANVFAIALACVLFSWTATTSLPDITHTESKKLLTFAILAAALTVWAFTRTAAKIHPKPASP